MQFAVMGRPGSGKTTVAKRLAQELKLPYIGSGDIARELAREDPTTRLTLDAGMMAPEEQMRARVHQRLRDALTNKGGYVLDGFPRTLAQWLCLRKWGAVPLVLVISTSEDECIERVVERMRPDDSPDATARRFEDYRALTHPLVEMLVRRQYTRTVSTDDRTEEDVFGRVLKLVTSQ